MKNKKILLLVLLASLLATLGTLSLFYSLLNGKAAEVLPVTRTLPVFAALFGLLVLKEKAGFIRLLTAAITFSGVYLILI